MGFSFLGAWKLILTTANWINNLLTVYNVSSKGINIIKNKAGKPLHFKCEKCDKKIPDKMIKNSIQYTTREKSITIICPFCQKGKITINIKKWKKQNKKKSAAAPPTEKHSETKEGEKNE